ncbi:hypothetical protein DK412_29775 [Methylobacterium sp. 17Sr1-1]|nr:hypothetical protein DK412_29775 [Methylobacterium sp. 17Sr1-1]
MCTVIAFAAASDPKGAFVFLQLPLIPMMALLDSVGMSQFLRNISWLSAYVIFVPATISILYIMGYVLGSIVKFIFR